MTPIELGNTLSTMTLPHIYDARYMDFGATSHMTHSSGNLFPLFNYSTKKYMLVGNDNRIMITGYGHNILPNQPFLLDVP